MDMLERLARAYLRGIDPALPKRFGVYPETFDMHLRGVRAVLTELREPSREVYLAPNWAGVTIERDIQSADAGKTVEFGITGYEAQDILNAMIDAILQEADKPAAADKD